MKANPIGNCPICNHDVELIDTLTTLEGKYEIHHANEYYKHIVIDKLHYLYKIKRTNHPYLNGK